MKGCLAVLRRLHSLERRAGVDQLRRPRLGIRLGIDNPQHIRRLKGREGWGSHRVVQPWLVRLIRAYIGGYCLGDWPTNDRKDRS